VAAPSLARREAYHLGITVDSEGSLLMTVDYSVSGAASLPFVVGC
jgi:hypothetical protein